MCGRTLFAHVSSCVQTVPTCLGLRFIFLRTFGAKSQTVPRRVFQAKSVCLETGGDGGRGGGGDSADVCVPAPWTIENVFLATILALGANSSVQPGATLEL